MSGKIKKLIWQAEQLQKSNSTDGTSSFTCAARVVSNDPEAKILFQNLKTKLFHINRWNGESVILRFKLYDTQGNAKNDEIARLEDFIEIILPGSGKSDWVRIIQIHEAPDEVVITVRPSHNPTEKDFVEKETSHFFTSDSTNNFCLERKDRTINLYVIGLNEKSNTQETANILETVRNFATANLGYYFGIQKLEWKGFSENFLEKSENVKE